MSKFKCTENSRDFVEVLRDKEGRPALTVGDNHSASVAFIAPSDAPALALAILEAAGVESAYRSTYNAGSDWQLEHAVNELSEYVRTRSTYEAEARERAELEAEAFKLYIAYMAVHEPLNAIGGWHMLAEHTKEKWLAVARRARELAKEATK